MSGPERIAVVGLDCRFPGAPDPQAYWKLLLDGADGTCEVPQQRWDAEDFHAAERKPGHSNTVRGGFIDDVDAFDNEFFGVSPREAAAMDPQVRLLLQTAWRALDDAGVPAQDVAGSRTGAFVGVMGNEWGFLQTEGYEGITAQTGSGNGYFMAANRLSYHLDLRGPSMAVDTACSSSLVAVHLACTSLLSGESDMALAGGTNLMMTPALNIFYTQAGLSAPDGRCKPFSHAADGIGRGEGIGVVVLRRLSDALADRQPVYAVISGTAVNQDGRSNGITAPSRRSQEDVIGTAWRRAGVTADDIRFLEAHGTGTILGDMIEARALGTLLAGRTTATHCAIGSVKGNIGHAEGAAGIAGLIKTALALHHRTVPPSRFARDENPKLKLAGHHMALVRSPLRLPAGTVHAGVSSFGIGGSNAHVVLSSAPRAVHRPAPGSPAVFTVSAGSPQALRRNLLVQADALARQPRDSFAQVCWNSNRVKSRLRFRAGAAAADPRAMVAALREEAERWAQDTDGAGASAPAAPSVAFLFTGQGAQHPGMAAQWYASSPAYARLLDEADAALRPHLDLSVRDAVLGEDPRVHRTGLAQPAIFAVEYAMAGALVEAGISPAAVLGHSIGEFAAAQLGGVLGLADAARLVARRGALMERQPDGGGMAAMELSAGEIRDLLADRPLLGLAAVNAPRSVVVSGDARELEALTDQVRAGGVRVRPLTVSHAFHSPLMRPMVEEFRRAFDDVRVAASRVPVFSTLYGRRLADGERMDAAYWAEQVTAPVRFAEAAADLVASGVTHVIEVGPRGTLVPLLRRGMPDGAEVSCHVAHPGPNASRHRPQELFAELYAAGLDPHWDVLYQDADRVPRRLPPYVFDSGSRFWHADLARPVDGVRRRPADGGSPAESAAAAAAPAGPTAAAGQAPGDDVDPVESLTRRLVSAVGGYAPKRITLRSRLQEDLNFDSIMVMELKTRLEREEPALGSLPVEELLASLVTVGDLVGYLQTRTGRHQAPAALPKGLSHT